ncbi:hypothetical protein [Aliarcobacter butzleri]|uniref:hypothetical protein n=1 Tax=Aliarcobacter butzleri TaxID=28197 RepID=UPI003AFACCB8
MLYLFQHYASNNPSFIISFALQSSQQYKVRFFVSLDFAKIGAIIEAIFSIAFVVANSLPHSTQANNLSFANIFSLNQEGCSSISSFVIVKQSASGHDTSQ